MKFKLRKLAFVIVLVEKNNPIAKISEMKQN